ncbi:MAG: Bacterial SH3 domain protein [Firmicutes bacterium ADurb.Bin300]|nr:MAG: Bacterial SH3 domain protein [Firmicutes bacterium ADurb.Bin300]
MKKKIFFLGSLLVILCIIFAGCNSLSETGESESSDSTALTSSLVYTLPAAGSSTGANSESSGTSESAANAGVSNMGTSISATIPYGGGTASSTNASSPEVYELGNYVVNTKTDPLSLRLAPSSSNDTTTICTIPKGTKVEVLALKGEWGYVVYGKTGGWVAMKYLKPTV